MSNHDQVRIQMTWGKIPVWGEGTWKINNKVLNDNQFQHEVKKEIEIYKANKQCYSPNEGWDIFKENIKEIAQERSTEISKQKRNELEEIRKDIKHKTANR